MKKIQIKPTKEFLALCELGKTERLEINPKTKQIRPQGISDISEFLGNTWKEIEEMDEKGTVWFEE